MTPIALKLVHDVNIIIKSWCGAQGQGPTIDLVFYVSAIKIDTYGYHAIQTHYILRHHVNMQLIKIPTTSYVNATKRWGHDFTRNREGNYSNSRVKTNVNGRIHKFVNYPFCLFAPNHLFLLEIG